MPERSTSARSIRSTSSPRLAAREGLWYHVDGAFGATAMMSPSSRAAPARHRTRRFDRVRFSQVASSAVRRRMRARARRRAASRYVRVDAVLSHPHAARSGERASVVHRLHDRPLARISRAQDVVHDQGARRAATRRGNRRERAAGTVLGDLIDADEDFELLAPVQLNIVCFRYRRAGLSEDELDRFNDELVFGFRRAARRSLPRPTSAAVARSASASSTTGPKTRIWPIPWPP